MPAASGNKRRRLENIEPRRVVADYVFDHAFTPIRSSSANRKCDGGEGPFDCRRGESV